MKRLYEDGDPRGLMAEHVAKLRDILARLGAACVVADMDPPGLRPHPLIGDYMAACIRSFNGRVTLPISSEQCKESNPPERRTLIH